MFDRWPQDGDWQHICRSLNPLPPEEPEGGELIPCRYCDSPDFEVRNDRSFDRWGVYCLDCFSYLGEIDTLEALVWIAHLRNYRRGWVYKEFLNFCPRPNLVELQEVEYVLGYRTGWAEHEYENLYGEEIKRDALVKTPSLKLIETASLYRAPA